MLQLIEKQSLVLFVYEDGSGIKFVHITDYSAIWKIGIGVKRIQVS